MVEVFHFDVTITQMLPESVGLTLLSGQSNQLSQIITFTMVL